MQTRSSSGQSQSEGDAEQSNQNQSQPKEQKPKCEWTLEDEVKLIDFLAEHSTRSGDGTTFRRAVWNAAADHINKIRTKGAQKTFKSCSEKWARVRGTSFQ
jgi:hypothetical protein